MKDLENDKINVHITYKDIDMFIKLIFSNYFYMVNILDNDYSNICGNISNSIIRYYYY